MKSKQLLTILLLFPLGLFAQNSDKIKPLTFFRMADNFLTSKILNGNVDYRSVTNQFDEIDSIYNVIAHVDLSDQPENVVKAFYINSYNIITIHQVALYYPVRSAYNINGFFSSNRHQIAGKKTTLDKLARRKLIKEYEDPRIHLVLACAAISGPQINQHLYRPISLEKDLEEITKKSLNDNNFVRIDHANQRVILNRIFEWYQLDFTMNSDNLIAYINQYRTLEDRIPQDYNIVYDNFNWSLNDYKKPLFPDSVGN